MPSGHDDWPDDGLGWTWREVVKWVLISDQKYSSGVRVSCSDAMIFQPIAGSPDIL